MAIVANETFTSVKASIQYSVIYSFGYAFIYPLTNSENFRSFSFLYIWPNTAFL